MSCAVDVNVLVYATNKDDSKHASAVRFIRDIPERRELVGIPYPVALGFLRIATHPRIFPAPLSADEALRYLQSLAALTNVRFLSERDGFFDVFRDVTGAMPVRGNLVPDAHVATILRQHDIRVFYTADRDFRRFPFLDVRDPFTPAASRR